MARAEVQDRETAAWNAWMVRGRGKCWVLLLVVMRHWDCAASQSRRRELEEGDGKRQWQRTWLQVSEELCRWCRGRELSDGSGDERWKAD